MPARKLTSIPITQLKSIFDVPDMHVPRIIQWSPLHCGYVGQCWCGRDFRVHQQTLTEVIGHINDHAQQMDE